MPISHRSLWRPLAFLLAAALLAACSEPTPSPEPTAPPTAVPTPLPEEPAAELPTSQDPCLVGVWRMPTGDLDLLVATLVPVPGMRVTDGELIMEFDGESFSYRADVFVLRVDLGADTYLEGDGRFGTSGTYTTGDGQLFLNSIGSEQDILTWTAYKDGEVVSMPGTGPTFSLPTPGEAPYRCFPDRLEIDTRGAMPETVTMFFGRSG